MLDGAVAEEQFPCDLAICSAGREESEDVEFATGESTVLCLGGCQSP
jgi:hypothetical protein